MAGMVLGVHFPSPATVVVLDNTKFKTEAINYGRKYGREFKQDNPQSNLSEMLKDLETRRRIPPHPCIHGVLWHWIKSRWRDKGVDPKHDHYGVPAGKIDQHWIDAHPEDYFDYAIAAEFVEETERIIVREIKNSTGKTERVSLFKRLMLLRSKNRESGIFDYEHYFFHILEADGKWAEKGYPGETEAPEIVFTTNLYPPTYRDKEGQWPLGGIDLYPKHGFGIKACLRELVHNQGKKEYMPALLHMEKLFPREAKDVGLIQELETEPTLNLNDEELWERFTKGVKKI